MKYIVYEYCRNLIKILTTYEPLKIDDELITNCAYGGGEFHYIVIDKWESYE